MAELDPVCGMMVEPQKAAGTSEYQGKTYYFCSRGCKVVFDRDPEKYLRIPPEQKGMHKH
jgi:YHS domain-containing protein